MTADTYDPILGLILQGTGNNNNTWGTIMDNSMITPAARAIGGYNVISATGGTVDLSGSPPPAALRQDIDAVQWANGALTSDLTIILPNLGKMFIVANGTTGAFQMFIKVPGGTSPSGLVQIPQGKILLCMLDGHGNVFRMDRADVGTLLHHGGTSAPAGALVCNGASLLRAEFPDLFNAISTTWGSVDGTHFTLPNFQDTGRFLRSSSGSLSVGTYQANQNLTHTHSGNTGNQSNDHTHSFSGTTGSMNANNPHTHSSNANQNPTQGTLTGGSGFAVASVALAGGATINSTDINHQHGFSGSTSGVSAGHTHAFTSDTGSAANGAEARPESAVVLICIRY